MKVKKKLTIFTPVFNRKKLLKRLYKSLLIQEDKRFEWLIIDDGSNDNVDKLIRKWMIDNKIDIRYIYQENQGKYIAHNRGVEYAKGELFFCVDSDDFLANNAVSSILEFWCQNKSKYISGILALKGRKNNKLIGDKLPNRLNNCSLYELSQKHKCKGDRSLIYRTDILKKYMFPEICNVKFIGESIIYDQIDQNYSMILMREVLTICEYQSQGYTSNAIDLIVKYPIGYKIYYNQRIDMAFTLKERLRYIFRYNGFKIMSNDKKYDYKGKYIFLVKALRPLGFLVYWYYLFKNKNYSSFFNNIG